ncbi:hypothetical protein [Candidatus Mycoplasma haematohominis]|uniref:hypothetical protein n=1 Tax=Candidatus Mycoplasma haematohominis TaxID=1494318 RepID=UPI001C0A6B80|nr:hypothetical protein [Candidatus Mycoplasma haemohominis]
MSTQAIGAAAAGTAVLGGGGVTIAYAAGAFNGESKYVDFNDYVINGGEFQYFGSTENETDDNSISSKVKALLKDATKKTKYKEKLKNNIKGISVSGENSNTKPNDDEIDKSGEDSDSDSSKLNKTAKFVHDWCKKNKITKPIAGNEKTKFTKQEIKEHKDWSKFEALCLEIKGNN